MNIDQSTMASNDDSENVILDLQMTIVAMQTEQEVAMKNKEMEAQNEIRSLQEQLRRLQNETNLLRSRQQLQPKKQQHQQKFFSNFEKSIPPSLDNADEMMDSLHSPVKILSPLSPLLANSNEISSHEIAPLQSNYDFLIQSPGERLIHHLLLYHPQQHCSVRPALEQDIERALARMFSSTLSEWEVIQWFIMEFMHVLSSTKTASIVPSAPPIGEPTPKTFVASEMLVPATASLSSQEEMARMQLLLHWLYDALSLSPSSCIYFRRCATKDNDINGAVVTNGPFTRTNPNSFVRRSNSISGRHDVSLPSTEPYDQQKQQEFRRIEQYFSHPLSSTSSLLPPHVLNAELYVDDEPSYVQCCFIQRLMLFLQTLCTFSSNTQVSIPGTPVEKAYNPEFRSLCIDLSILSMQFVSQLLLPSKDDDGRRDDGFFWDVSTLDTILTNVISIGTLLLAQSSLSERRRNNDSNGGPPRRLAHVEFLQRREKNTSFARIMNDSTPLEENAVSSYMKWIVEAIQFLSLVVWNENISVLYSSNLERMWMDTKRTASIVSLLLDLLQHVILPETMLYNHPLTGAIISFFHSLIRPKKIETRGKDQTESKNASEKQNYFYWCILLCHHVTDHSTEELWRTGPTAIDISVQLLHRIVVRQLVDDHLPSASSNTLFIISLIPARDQIIRFIHRVLLYVQNDRRWWDAEQAIRNEQGQESKRKKPLSFTRILSENVELYKSAAGSILSIPSNDDSIHYCSPNPDIRSMLTLQINELLEDAMEELQN
jgi:hypothetical protein